MQPQDIYELEKSIRDFFSKKADSFVANVDSYEAIKKLPPESIDLILTDPPYGVNFNDPQQVDRWRSLRDNHDAIKEWDGITQEQIELLAREFFRILKQDTACYVFVNKTMTGWWFDAFERAGFSLKNVLVWIKPNPTPRFFKRAWLSSIEFLLYFEKGKPTFNYTYERCKGYWVLHPPSEKLHPTQKPREILQDVILTSSNPGDVVFDPFAGSGMTGFVASTLDRRPILFEKSKEYFSAIGQRFLDMLYTKRLNDDLF